MTAITDIKLIKQINGSYDIELDNDGNLIADNGYGNAMLITFATDARALPNQVPNSQNRRGWFGNLFNEDITSDIGSKLWILETRNVSTASLNEGIALLTEAYNWLIEQGRASRINIVGQIRDSGYSFDIAILNGNDIIESNTFEFWKNTNAT